LNQSKNIDGVVQRRKWTRRLLRLGRWLAVLAVLLVLAATTFGFWMSGNAGKAWLKEKAEASLSTPDRSVSIGRLSGDVFSEIGVHDIAVADRQGPWLRLRQVDVKWKPADLLGGRLTIDNARVQGGSLMRLPAANEKQGDASLPDLPVALALASFEGDLAFDGQQYDIRVKELRLSSALLQGELEVRTSAGSDYLQLAGQWTGRDGPFSFEASLSAGANGLIPALIPLHYAGATEASLKGEGTFDEWAANLNLTASDQVQLQADGRGENGVWTARLRQDRNLLLDGVAGSLLGGDVEASLTMTPLAGQSWPFQLKVQATDLAAALDGRLETTDGLAILGGRFDGRIAQVEAGSDRASNLTAEGSLQYTKGAFEASYGLEVGSAAFDDMKAENLRAKGSVQGVGGNWRGRVTALTGQLGWRNLEEEIASGAADWAFDSQSSRWAVDIPALTTKSENRLSANAGGDASGVETASVTLSAASATLATWAPINPDGGRLDARASLVRRANGLYDLEGEAKGAEIGFTDTYTDRLFGTAPTISLQAGVSANGTTEISQAVLKGPGIVAHTEGQVSSAALDMSYDAVISALPRQLTSAVAMDGTVTVRGTVQGSPGMPRISFRTGLDELAGYGVALSNVGLEMALTKSAKDDEGWLGNGGLAGRSKMGIASADIDVSVAPEGQVDLDAILKHPGLTGAVSLSRTQAGDVQASLEARAVPGEYDGLRVAGQASLVAQYRATSGAADADIRVNGRDILVAVGGRLPFEAGAVDAYMRVPLAGTTAKPLLNAEVTDVRSAQYQVNSLSVTADNESLDRFHLEGVGWAVHPFSLAFDISSAPGRMELIGSAEYGGYQIGIQEPATLEFGKATNLAAPSISVNEGTVSLTVQLSANSLITDATLENLDLGLVNLIRPGLLQEGTASGQLKAGWQRGRTESLKASLDLRDMLFLPEGFVTLQESTRYAAHVLVQTKASILEMKGEFSDPNGAIGSITGMLPYRFDADARSFELRENAPLTAVVTWTGEVEPLWRLSGRGDHLLDGEATGELKVEGTLNEPVFSGGLELSGGRYEYLPMGLVASIDELSIIGSGDQVKLASLRASDFENGRLSAQGAFELSSRLSFPGSLSLKMEDFQVARLDMLRGKVSAGCCQIKTA
jgi:translocation and assembly module TamB